MDFDYLRYISSDTTKRKSQTELMTAYGNDVWNYAFMLVKDIDLANDITRIRF